MQALSPLFPLHRFSDLSTYSLKTVYLSQPIGNLFVHPSHDRDHVLVNRFHTA